MICEGSSFSNGNMKPVALVRMVVSRNKAVRPGIACDLSSPYKTTRPETIPIRLMTTCNTVTACKLKPSIMTLSPCFDWGDATADHRKLPQRDCASQALVNAVRVL